MFTRSADLLGSLNGLLCLVHCLAMPFLIGLGATFLSGPIVAFVFIALAGAAAWTASRSATWRMRSTFLITWVLFTLGILLEHRHLVFEYLGLVASVGMVLLHLVNFRQRGQCAARRPSE